MSNLVTGHQQAIDGASSFSATKFVVEMMLGKRAHAIMVEVMAVTNTGLVAPTGTVDVMPLVNQLDASGNIVPASPIYGLPYFRLRGTAGSAVIMDPAIGDIGLAVIADRDISSLKASRAGPVNPGSDNQNNEADGLFFGAFLDTVPTQYIQFSATGISIVTPQNLTITALNVTLDADGNLATKGNVTWNTGSTATDAAGHKHSGVQTGSGQTGVPVPGT